MNNTNKFGLPPGLGGVPNNTISRPVGIYQVPTDFVELPSKGRFYPQGSPLHGVEKLEIKYMTAKEEDLMMSPGLQKAGIALDRVIESLLVDKSIKAKELLVGDKNAILINARKNAFGDSYEFNYICEKCGTENICSKDLNDISFKEIVDNENCSINERGHIVMRLPKSGATLELKFLSGEDETNIDQILNKKIKNNLPTEALITRYRFMILSVNGSDEMETIISFINSMPIADSAFLRKNYASLNPDVEFKYSHECKNCSNLNEGDVPVSANFFWG